MLHLGPRHFKCSVNTLNIPLYFNQNCKTVFGSLNYFDLDSGIKTELIKKRSRKIQNTAPSSGMSSRHTYFTSARLCFKRRHLISSAFQLSPSGTLVLIRHPFFTSVKSIFYCFETLHIFTGKNKEIN